MKFHLDPRTVLLMETGIVQEHWEIQAAVQLPVKPIAFVASVCKHEHFPMRSHERREYLKERLTRVKFFRRPGTEKIHGQTCGPAGAAMDDFEIGVCTLEVPGHGRRVRNCGR